MENVKAFFEAVAADENLTKALSEVKTKEELIEFAARHGHVLTEQDMNDIAKIASAYAKQQSGEPLSDEELELVSGGGVITFMVAAIGMIIYAIGGTLVFGAAAGISKAVEIKQREKS